MRMPPQVMPRPRHRESPSVVAGRRERRTAAAAGAIRRAAARRIPTASALAAAARARITRKNVDRRRTGTPRARAASGSTVAKSSGRKMPASTAATGAAIASRRRMSWGRTLRSDPNRMAIPAFAWDALPRAYRLRKKTPSPSAKETTIPISTLRSRAFSPIAPMPRAAPSPKTAAPRTGATPKSAAPVAPAKDTSSRDSAAKAWARRTTKYPTSDATAAAIVPAIMAFRKMSEARSCTVMRARPRDCALGFPGAQEAAPEGRP